MIQLSVIIPTLDAAMSLPETLAALGDGREVIVADGGSRDETAEIAAGLGARVILAPRGRGAQLAAGVARASIPGCCCCTPTPASGRAGWRRRSRTAAPPIGPGISASRSTAPMRGRGGWSGRSPGAAGRLALPYGDQGLLIHRDLLGAVGGIKPLPLMEDVDLAHRLGRRRLIMLAADARTSAARWEREGWTRRSARNLACLALWYAGLPPALIARAYG